MDTQFRVFENKEDKKAYYRAQASLKKSIEEGHVPPTAPTTAPTPTTAAAAPVPVAEPAAAHVEASRERTDKPAARTVHKPAGAEAATAGPRKAATATGRPVVPPSGKLECIVCKREDLATGDFSTKALQNFRSKARKPLKCKECVLQGEQEERRAAAARLLERAAQLGEAAEQDAASCSACNVVLPRLQFNKNQLNKGDKKRCKACVEAADAQAEAALQQSKSTKIQDFVSKLATLDRSEETLKEARAAASAAVEAKKLAAVVKAREKKAAGRSTARAERSRGDDEAAVDVAVAVAPVADPETGALERKAVETKEDRIAFFRAQAALKKAQEAGSEQPAAPEAAPARAVDGGAARHGDPRKAFDAAALPEIAPVESAAAPKASKEERIAYFRAQAALKTAQEAGEGGARKAPAPAPSPASAHAPLASKVVDAVTSASTGKRQLAAVSAPAAGHDDSRYLKKFTVAQGDGNGQNKKVKF